MPVSVDARGAAAAPRGGHRINMVTAGSMQLPALLMQICAIYLGMSAFAVSQETPESRHAASALMRTALSRAAPLVTPVEKLDRHKDQPNLIRSLEPHAEGLELLRSPALRDRPVMVASVVGQARTGKSFFMNSVFGARQQFEVGSTQDGVTEGLWISVLPEPQPVCNSSNMPSDLSQASDFVTRADELNSSRAMNICSQSSEQTPATLLIDTEGLGAPGDEMQNYGSKLVALASLLSSVTFYNAMRTVNQMEISFLGDVVLFDEVFRNETLRLGASANLMKSQLVWIVQSYGMSDGCAEYPHRFLQPSRTSSAHAQIIKYVRSRALNYTIFCLPRPSMTTPESELSALAWEDLDTGYVEQIQQIRNFLRAVRPKPAISGAGWMTGGQLASLVERILPQLNNVEGAVGVLIGLKADTCRAEALDQARDKLEQLFVQMSRCNSTFFNEDGIFAVHNARQRAGAVAAAVRAQFQSCLKGGSEYVESFQTGPRQHFEEALLLLLSRSKLQLEMGWQKCRPDAAIAALRDYYTICLLLPIDGLVSFATWFLRGESAIWSSRSRLLLQAPHLVISQLPRIAVAATLLKSLPKPLLERFCFALPSGYPIDTCSSAMDSSNAFGVQQVLDATLRLWADNVSPLCESGVDAIFRWTTEGSRVVRWAGLGTTVMLLYGQSYMTPGSVFEFCSHTCSTILAVVVLGLTIEWFLVDQFIKRADLKPETSHAMDTKDAIAFLLGALLIGRLSLSLVQACKSFREMSSAATQSSVRFAKNNARRNRKRKKAMKRNVSCADSQSLDQASSSSNETIIRRSKSAPSD